MKSQSAYVVIVNHQKRVSLVIQFSKACTTEKVGTPRIVAEVSVCL